jgi:hypothetical protein
MADGRKYPNSGAIFSQAARGRGPTWTGKVELDGALLKELVDSWKTNGEAVVSISGWDREGQRGPWISIKVERFGAWRERAPSNNRNRDDRRDDRDRDDRDRRTARSRDDDDDRRAPPRRRTERKDDDLDDDIPW